MNIIDQIRAEILRLIETEGAQVAIGKVLTILDTLKEPIDKWSNKERKARVKKIGEIVCGFTDGQGHFDIPTDYNEFIRYNLDILMESMDIFSDYLNRKIKEQDTALENIRLYDLSTRQEDILAEMIQSSEPFTVYELSSMFNTNAQSIRKDLIVLMDNGLVNICGKEGHRIKYVYNGQK